MRYEYYLQLADTVIRISAPYQVGLEPRMLPFLIEKREEDISYELESADGFDLSGIPLVYQGSKYSIYEDGQVRYRQRKGSESLALLERKKSDSRVSLLKGTIKIESTFLLNLMAMEEPLLQYNAFFFHASFVRWKGRGILFSGPSGIGKSTQAELWQCLRGADIINGDQPIIRRHGTAFYAYGSMFAGSSHIYRNESAPIAAIVVLEQAEENSLSPLHGRHAFRKIYSQMLVDAWNPDFVEKITDELLLLLEHVPVYLLKCRPDGEAVELVRQEMERLYDGAE